MGWISPGLVFSTSVFQSMFHAPVLISGAQWGEEEVCGQIGLGNNACYTFFRKCSVWFNPVFLKHLAQEPCLFLSNGIHLGKLLLCAEGKESHNSPDCGWVGKMALSGVCEEISISKRLCRCP